MKEFKGLHHSTKNSTRMELVALLSEVIETKEILHYSWTDFHKVTYHYYYKFVSHKFETKEYTKNGKFHQDTLHIFEFMNCDENGNPKYDYYKKNQYDTIQLFVKRWSKIA